MFEYPLRAPRQHIVCDPMDMWHQVAFGAGRISVCAPSRDPAYRFLRQCVVRVLAMCAIFRRNQGAQHGSHRISAISCRVPTSGSVSVATGDNKHCRTCTYPPQGTGMPVFSAGILCAPIRSGRSRGLCRAHTNLASQTAPGHERGQHAQRDSSVPSCRRPALVRPGAVPNPTKGAQCSAGSGAYGRLEATMAPRKAHE